MNYLSTLGKTLLTVSILAFASTAIAQNEISLYLKPDSSSMKVDTIDGNDPLLESSGEMPWDIGDATIWKWMELNKDYEGFVRRNYVAKGTGLQPGAPVYFIPGDEDAFLTIYEETHQVEIIEAVDETWAKIKITTAIPVYFEVAAPAIEPEEEIVAVEKPAVEEPVVEENYEAESTYATDLPDEPSDLGVDATPSSGPIDRILEGTLVRYKPIVPNPFKKSRYEWQLINKQKQRLAFVDPSNLILSIPFKSYRDRRVSINGSVYQVNKGKDILIVAHQISKL